MLPKDASELQLPEERRATCHRCPKVQVGGFNPGFKCCTYHPRVPNFLLGLGLQSEATRTIVEHHIQRGFCLPEGAYTPPAQWLAAVEIGANQDFGRTEKVRCHFLNPQKGTCGIYPVRNAICSTFFCYNDHGAAGAAFWEHLQETVSQIETALGQWCLEQLGFDIAELMAVYDSFAQDLAAACAPQGHAWSEKARKALYGPWFGQETKLMERCGMLVTDHRDNLYQIANEVKLQEPRQFEQALVAMVPDEAQTGLDAGYASEGNPANIDDLWYLTKASERRLWKIPFGEGQIRLNSAASITTADPNAPTSRFYSKLGFVVRLRESANDKTYTWQQYIDKTEAEALRHFKEPRPVDESLTAAPALAALSFPQKFLAEWLRKNVLQWVIP